MGGSGCALVSSTLSKLGAQVFATDLKPFVAHVEYNLSLNRAPETETLPTSRSQALDWGDLASRRALRDELGENGADVIFAANCIYCRDVVPDFLGAVKSLAGPRTMAFIRVSLIRQRTRLVLWL